MTKSPWKDLGARVGGLVEAGRRLVARTAPLEEDQDERRRTKRVAMALPVEACLAGGRFRRARTIDLNIGGFGLESAGAAEVGQEVAVRFPGVPRVVAPFMLSGTVVRSLADGVGIEVDRTQATREQLEQYRTMVLFYLRRKPLLEQMGAAYFEAACTACDWVGRVSRRSPECSRCGSEVEPR